MNSAHIHLHQCNFAPNGAAAAEYARRSEIHADLKSRRLDLQWLFDKAHNGFLYIESALERLWPSNCLERKIVCASF